MYSQSVFTRFNLHGFLVICRTCFCSVFLFNVPHHSLMVSTTLTMEKRKSTSLLTVFWLIVLHLIHGLSWLQSQFQNGAPLESHHDICVFWLLHYFSLVFFFFFCYFYVVSRLSHSIKLNKRFMARVI